MSLTIDLDFAIRFEEFLHEFVPWSQETFGSDHTNGPVGPLKKLEIESREAQQDPKDVMELADCFICLLDATRRAGYTPLELVEASHAKLKINKTRKYPMPADGECSQHIE